MLDNPREEVHDSEGYGVGALEQATVITTYPNIYTTKIWQVSIINTNINIEFGSTLHERKLIYLPKGDDPYSSMIRFPLLTDFSSRMSDQL